MQRSVAILVACLAGAGSILGDIVAPAAGTQFTGFPAGFDATFPPGNGIQGNPYWNDRSSDFNGPKANAGYFLTANSAGAFVTQTNYLGSGSFYRSATSDVNLAPTTFHFLQEASTISVTVLYTSASQNFGVSGTQIGIYNVDDPTQKIPLFGPGVAAGDLWNEASGFGIFNANYGPTPSVSGVATYARWGLYAITCQNPGVPGSPGQYQGTGPNCATYYSNTALNTARADGSLEGYVHQHFALFQLGSNTRTFFVGLEDIFGLGIPNIEATGDYNDIILQIVTSGPAIPEPATVAFVGLGLVGIGAVGLRRRKA
jgi:hypothetical protein